MKIESPKKDQLGIAFNEAKLLGVEFSPEHNAINCTFSLLSLDAENKAPTDARVIVVLHPIGRISASLRKGRWDNYDGELIEFKLEDLLKVVQTFEGQPIYGWNFINTDDDNFDKWSDRLSCSYISTKADGLTNTFSLFQEFYDEKHLDLKIWFDKMVILDSSLKLLDMDEFIRCGQRAWDAIMRGAPNAAQFGILPATEENNKKITQEMDGEFHQNTKSDGKRFKTKALEALSRIFQTNIG